MINDIIRRIFATFTVAALGTVGAGALFGVEVWKAAAMAGAGACAVVLEALSRAYLNDGKLTIDEVNTVFNKYATGELQREEAQEVAGH